MDDRPPSPYPPYRASDTLPTDSVHLKPANGSAFLKSNLFIFLLGQTFAFICWAIIASSVYGRFDQKITEWEKWKLDTQVTLTRMDSTGTNAGVWADTQHAETMKHNTERIDKLEAQATKIDVMAEKVSRIDESVKRLEERK